MTTDVVLLTGWVAMEGHYVPRTCPVWHTVSWLICRRLCISCCGSCQHEVTRLCSMASGTLPGSSSCLAFTLLISLSLCSLSWIWAAYAGKFFPIIPQLYERIFFKCLYIVTRTSPSSIVVTKNTKAVETGQWNMADWVEEDPPPL